MRVVCVWSEGYDYSRTVEEWIRDYEHQTSREIESIDPQSREGETFCQAYDILEYPTILALGDDGAVRQMWRGKMMPRFDEVAYWA